MASREECQVMEARITDLTKELNKFFLKECEKKHYSAAELYIATKCWLASISQLLGPEAVKQIDKNFQIVVPQGDKLTC